MNLLREQISKLNGIITELRNDISQHNILNFDSFDTDIASYIMSSDNPFAPKISVPNILDYKYKYITIHLKNTIDIDFDILNKYHQIQISHDMNSDEKIVEPLTSAYINGMRRKFPKPICSINDLEEFLISDIESFKLQLRRYNVLLHPCLYKDSLNEYRIENLSLLTNGIFTEYTSFLNLIPESVFIPKTLRYEIKYERIPSIYTFISDY